MRLKTKIFLTVTCSCPMENSLLTFKHIWKCAYNMICQFLTYFRTEQKRRFSVVYLRSLYISSVCIHNICVQSGCGRKIVGVKSCG